MKPKINQLINKSVVRLKKGSPTVLTCLGVAGVVATTVSAVMATPKAIEKIRKESIDYDDKTNKGVLCVGRQLPNKSVDIVNAIDGPEAKELFVKLITKKAVKK